MEICKTNNPTLSSNRFFHVIRMTDFIVAIFPDMLYTKCVKIPYDNVDKYCIVSLVNNIERD